MNPLEWLVNFIVSKIFALYPQPEPNREHLKRVRLVAHRGVHELGGRENSHEAFALALQNKISAIEFDVRFTKDHVAVISHDPDCKRLFARPDLVIAETEFNDLHREVPNLLTLQNVVEEFGGRLHFMIEIKEDLKNRPAEISELKRELKNLKPLTDFHLLSLNPDFLTPITEIPTSCFMDVIWLSPTIILQKNYELGHGGVAGHFLLIKTQDIQQLHADWREVGVGFLDSKNSLYREVNRGADWIFTNHPLRLQKFIPA